MKKAVVFSVLLMVVMVMILGSCTKAQAQSLGQVRWEYTTIATVERNRSPSYLSTQAIIEEANRLGREGWELVSSFDADSRGIIFKRRLP